MANVPKRVAERIVAGIKRFQPVLSDARSRDVGESDTVTIVKDMLAEVFGYDKYAELTSEYSIRGTYCDLATKIDGTLQALIEAKAIGLDLKDAHVKQAVDYAANQGVDWVLLTNGVHWRVYHVVFAKPIDHELIVDIDFCALNHRTQSDIETLYLWCKEGWQRSMLGEYRDQRQALSRFFVGRHPADRARAERRPPRTAPAVARRAHRPGRDRRCHHQRSAEARCGRGRQGC